MTVPESDTPQKSLFTSAWLYLGFGLFILALLVWSSLRTLRETPARQASAQVPGQGWVTLTLTTDPFPPTAGAPALLNVTAENENDSLVTFSSGLPFAIGQQGSQAALETGTAQLAVDGAGYQSRFPFPSPGSYWVDYEIVPGTKIRFRLEVEPAL